MWTIRPTQAFLRIAEAIGSLRRMADYDLVCLRSSNIVLRKSAFAQELEAHYGPAWIEHFSGTSIKAAWKELTQSGSGYPSLSTFYAHVKRSSLSGYMRYDTSEVIFRILNVNDANLLTQAASIRDLTNDLVEFEKRIVRELAFVKLKTPYPPRQLPDILEFPDRLHHWQDKRLRNRAIVSKWIWK